MPRKPLLTNADWPKLNPNKGDPDRLAALILGLLPTASGDQVSEARRRELDAELANLDRAPKGDLA